MSRLKFAQGEMENFVFENNALVKNRGFRVRQRKHNKHNNGNISLLGWEKTTQDVFNRTDNQTMGNYMRDNFDHSHVPVSTEIVLLNDKNVGRRYMQYVDLILGKVASMIPMIKSMRMIQGTYHKMLPGANNRAGGSARKEQEASSGIYTLLIPFRDMDVVLEPVHRDEKLMLTIPSKQCAIIDDRVTYWIAANGTKNAYRWLDIKITGDKIENEV